jgi:hypothetical protein
MERGRVQVSRADAGWRMKAWSMSGREEEVENGKRVEMERSEAIAKVEGGTGSSRAVVRVAAVAVLSRSEVVVWVW